MVLLMLLLYVFSVLATNLYGEAFPKLFGSIWLSAFSLFQVMTLGGLGGRYCAPAYGSSSLGLDIFHHFYPDHELCGAEPVYRYYC